MKRSQSVVLGPRLISLKNQQGLPSHRRAGLKRQAERKISEKRTRVATLNVGSMTEKGRELFDLMERRKIGVLRVQETWWKGNNARELGEGCKLYHSKANLEERNGVRMILSKELMENLIGVNRKNDRIKSLKLRLVATIINVVSASAPQTGCTQEEKDIFWEEVDQELGIIPAKEKVIIGGDLNGHLGISREGIESEWRLGCGKVILRIGEEVLGKSSGIRPPNDKKSWWWYDEVQKRIKTKKEAKKKADLSGQKQNKENYEQAKKKARRAVAKAKAETLNEVYKQIEAPEEEKKILRIDKAQEALFRDLTHIRSIKDSNCIVLAEENEIKRRWETYFEGLLNEENTRTVFEDGLPNKTVTIGVTTRGVAQAVKKMKNSKATGPDSLPVEVWKSLGEEGIDILWDLTQKIFNR
ncbi:uncharacterized protein [Palaemon carinicauda]|uniref:uncharacterized protein n=1 Tax=Palaemon carinicauda TaxID=392227 RepID=UPI0035B6111D